MKIALEEGSVQLVAEQSRGRRSLGSGSSDSRAYSLAMKDIDC